jgi:hypothetical protein
MQRQFGDVTKQKEEKGEDPNFERKLDLITEGVQPHMRAPINQDNKRELSNYNRLYPGVYARIKSCTGISQ